jgi:peptidoglycan L-alanyl-D-glutamate endopeptidase CwlK
MAKHTNNGACPKCLEILGQAHENLVDWFQCEQKKDPELHVSCAYRGKIQQDDDFDRGVSKATFGKSPHNYMPALALDVFYIIGGIAKWPMDRYRQLAADKPDGIEWGADWNDNGRTDDEKFIDAPHFQVKGWKAFAKGYPKGQK